MLSQSKRQTSYEFYKNALKLAIGGGVVFWATTLATSLLPIAAEYRAAFSKNSWNIQTVWVDSLLAGWNSYWLSIQGRVKNESDCKHKIRTVGGSAAQRGERIERSRGSGSLL